MRFLKLIFLSIPFFLASCENDPLDSDSDSGSDNNNGSGSEDSCYIGTFTWDTGCGGENTFTLNSDGTGSAFFYDCNGYCEGSYFTFNYSISNGSISVYYTYAEVCGESQTPPDDTTGDFSCFAGGIMVDGNDYYGPVNGSGGGGSGGGGSGGGGGSSTGSLMIWTDEDHGCGMLLVYVDGNYEGQVTGFYAGADPECGDPYTVTLTGLDSGSYSVSAECEDGSGYWPSGSITVYEGGCSTYLLD